MNASPDIQWRLRPEVAFGHRPGDDRRLIRWDRLRTYFQDLAATSNCLKYEEYGLGWGDQPLALLTISSPGNLARLDDLQAVQRRVFDSRGLSAGDLTDLSAAGRCVCLITCSIHATEVGPTQLMPEFVHQLVTADDDATRRMLDELVILIVPCLNPGGLEQVAGWYDATLGTPHEGTPPPALYHPYAGHDNNRDWFMLTQAENERTVEHIFNRWFPTIVFDLHQMQVNGPRFVVPPYIDPYDPNVDPLMQARIDALGTSIAAGMTARGLTGVAHSVIFDAYSPSRAYSHYHGGVRVLAEAASARIASPVEVPRDILVETRGFDPKSMSHVHPSPWRGGAWRLRDILDYLSVALFELLEHAAVNRRRWIESMVAVQRRARDLSRPHAFLVLPYAFQRDAGETAELLRVMTRGLVEVERARDAFLADGVEFPAGTFVIRLAQPASRFAKTLLEVQHYPVQQVYPGGPPKQPYDITAHTLPLMMGVDVLRVETPLSTHLTRLDEIPRPPGVLSVRESQRWCILSPESNASALAINRLLAASVPIGRITSQLTVEARRYPAGSVIVDVRHYEAVARMCLSTAVLMNGIDDDPPDVVALEMPRLGVYRSWKPNAIDEGWTRFVLERYEFPFQTVRDADLKRPDLSHRFDVILLPQQSARDILDGNNPGEYPVEYTGGIGEAGAANLRRFVEGGGTLIALDSACDLAIRQLYLPVSNVLESVRAETFSAPGSLLRILIDAEHPIGWGFEREAAAMFVASPAFEVRGPARVVAQYPLANQLLSGWLHGGDLLAGRGAIVETPVGHGRAILIGFRPQFRAQTRGSYRVLFNAILSAGLAS